MRPNTQPLAGTGSRILIAVAAVILAAATAACGPEPTLRGEIELTIGSADAESEYEFVFPLALTRDADGRIYVGDRFKENVRVYDSEGRYLFHLTLPGRGGGSRYLRPTGLLFDPDGHLWVNDVGSYRVFDILEDRAEHLREIPPPSEERRLPSRRGTPLATVAGTTTPGNPMFAGPTGLILATDSVSADERDELVWHRQQVTVGPDGDVRARVDLPEPDTVYANWPVLVYRRDPDPGLGTVKVRPPYANQQIRAHAPDGRSAYIYTSEYRVRLFTANGEEWREIRRDIAGPLVTESEAERERLERFRAGWGERLVDFPAIEVPERKPPVEDMWYDEDGRLWVRLAAAEADEVSRAHVHDPDGEPLFTAEWPRGIDLSLGGVSGVVALGVQGMPSEPRVVRLRFFLS
ncbi:hypothetical protein [Candidatus Palauibacter sp.]|uniref:hypothetical protein n=1 Tax=Candidatus Palauibacter sp. TaxID=3101350 RepID=UPI003B522FF9